MKQLQYLLFEERFGIKSIHELLISSYQFTEKEATDLMAQYVPFYMALEKMLIKKENA